jgi:predicted transcriptional regulator of viral defense system
MSWKQAIKSEIENNDFDLGYFTLQDFYRTSLNNLEQKFNENSSCEASIRANFQKLRNDGYLEFIAKGKYRVISEENDEWIQFIENYHKKKMI